MGDEGSEGRHRGRPMGRGRPESGLGGRGKRRPTPTRGRYIVLVGLLVAVSLCAATVNLGAQERTSEQVPLGERVQAALQQARVSAAYRSMARTPGELARLQRALNAHGRGEPAEAVKEQARRERETWQRSRDAAGLAAGTAVATVAGGAVALAAPAGVLGALLVGAVAATAGIGAEVATDSYARELESGYEERVLAAGTGSELFRVVERALEDESFEEIWESEFAPSAGVSATGAMGADLDGALAEIVAALEERVAGSEAQLLGVVREHKASLETAVKDELGRLREQAGDYRESIEEYVSEVRERWAFERGRAEKIRLRRVKAVDTANARSVVATATVLIGLEDPDAGRRLSAVAEGYFKVNDALKAYEEAMRLGASGGWAAAALTGDFVTIGLSLLTAFGDMGPTAEEVILDELRELRREMQEGFRLVQERLGQVQREMHERFDALDGRFDEVDARFDGMEVRFDRIGRQIESLGELVAEGFTVLEESMDRQAVLLSGLRDQLDSQGSVLNDLAIAQQDLYNTLTRELRGLRNFIANMGLRQCLVEGRASMDSGRFGDCLGTFSAVVEDLVGEYEGRPEAEGVLEGVLEAGGGPTTSLSYEEFRRLAVEVEAPDVPRLPAAVVAPGRWLAIAANYDRFLNLYGTPELNEQFRGAIAAVTHGLRTLRSQLESYIVAVRNELDDYQSRGDGGTAFSALFRELWSEHDRLAQLVESTLMEYYANGGVAGGTSRVGSNGTRIPELGHGGPYAWSPMSEFYRLDEVPPWITARRYDGCGMAQLRRRASLLDWGGDTNGVAMQDRSFEWSPASEEWFRGDGLLNFVSENDLIPARMGMGQIEVCVTGASGSGKGTRLAVQVWLRGNSIEEESACGGILFYGIAQGGSRVNAFDLSAGLLDLVRGRRGRGVALIDATEATMSPCQRLYLSRAAANRAVMEGELGDLLRANEEYPRVARALRIASRHLEAWLGLAFDNAIDYSATLQGIASGGRGLIDVDELLDRGRDVWELADSTGIVIEALEELLVSAPMRDVASYGFGHRVITGVRLGFLEEGE